MSLPKSFLATLLILLTPSHQVHAQAVPPPPGHPNVIYILMDDMGYGDLGCFFQNGRPPEKPRLATPNLDRMAAEGMKFTNHYCAAPVCAPSRSSLMQGLSQGHDDLRDNEFDRPLLEDHTLGSILQQAGYYTSVIGKWGIGGYNPPWPAHPLRRGFNEFYGYLRHKDAHHHYPQPGDIFDGETPVTTGLQGIYSADLFTARAKQFIVDRAEHHREQPFFLYLAYVDPHGPMEVPPGPYPAGSGLKGGMQMPLTAYGVPNSYVYPEYVGKKWPDKEKAFASMIHHIDDCVGDVLQTLRDTGIDRNTLVIFTSDNGPHNEGHSPAFFDSWAGFDGIKRDLFEGGAREPTIVRWPGQIKADASSNELSEQYDWLATLADAAGLPVPASRDGISLLPTLLGRPQAQRHHLYLYSEFFGTPDGWITPQILHRKGYTARRQEQAVRIGDFAGVRYDIQSPDDPLRLYNVALDPHEDHDLSQDPAVQPVLAQMKTLLVTARTSNVDAPRPYDNVPLPAVSAPAVTGSLTLQRYRGEWPWVPDFHGMTPVANESAAGFVLPPAKDSAAFGAEWTGFIKVPVDGRYQFTVQSDGGAVLWVHDALLVHDDFHPVGAPVAGAPAVLAAGWHPIRLAYRHAGSGVPVLKVTLKGPESGPLLLSAAAPGFDRASFAPAAH